MNKEDVKKCETCEYCKFIGGEKGAKYCTLFQVFKMEFCSKHRPKKELAE